MIPYYCHLSDTELFYNSIKRQGFLTVGSHLNLNFLYIAGNASP